MHFLPSLSRARAPRIICTVSNMQYLGKFDLKDTKSARNSYADNKLYFQTWLTELQDRMSKHASYEHITIQGVHPGFVKTNIWIVIDDNISWLGRVVVIISRYVGKLGIDPQQGSLAITHAATAQECGSALEALGDGGQVGRGGGRFFNRIWEEDPMPHAKSSECRRQIWEYVSSKLKLEEKELLRDLGSYHDQ